jgi:hypothetical protein
LAYNNCIIFSNILSFLITISQYSELHQYIRYYNFLGFWFYVHIIRYISSWNASYKAKGNTNWYTNYTADFSDPVGREIKQSLFVTSTLSRFESASIWYSLILSNLMTDFTESIAFLSIVKIFICRYSPWQIRIFAIHPRFPSPMLILLLFQVNINECRVLQVSLVLRFKFKTDLIINWIYPIKTHSREPFGKSTTHQIRISFHVDR